MLYFLSFFLFQSHGMWDLSSPTRDWPYTPCCRNSESYPLDHQESPRILFIFKNWNSIPIKQQLPTPTLPLAPGNHYCIFYVFGYPRTQLSDFTFTSHFHALEKEMATHAKCSCLENPRDGGAWWAAVCGVAQSRTRLKWLSSSSSRYFTWASLVTQTVKNLPAYAGDQGSFHPWVGKIPWRRKWQPTPVFLPGESHA